MTGFDLISNLPDNVLSSILVFLPIKEAIRTCILSKRWRHLWTSIPNLEFEEEEDRAQQLVTDEKRRDLVSIIDKSLESREISIRSFRISFFPKRYSYHVDRWIIFLIKNGIEDLNLMFTIDHIWDNDWHGRYELPSCFFHCKTLRLLKLSACIFKPPSSFQGFGSLETLVLGDISLSEDLIRGFLPKCKTLRSLTLQRCEGFEILDISDPTSQLECLIMEYCHCYIEIYAPKVRDFHFYGEWLGFSLKETLLLANVVIYLKSHPYHREPIERNLKTILADLVHVESLSLIGLCFKCLAAGRVLSSFHVIKKLELELSLEDEHVCFGAFDLIQNCPSLKEFIVWIKFDARGKKGRLGYWEIQQHLACSLQRINVNRFSGLKFEMEFVNFLLLNSPDLRRMSINTENDVDLKHYHSLAEKLLPLQRASLHVEILLNQVKIEP